MGKGWSIFGGGSGILELAPVSLSPLLLLGYLHAG